MIIHGVELKPGQVWVFGGGKSYRKEWTIVRLDDTATFAIGIADGQESLLTLGIGPRFEAVQKDWSFKAEATPPNGVDKKCSNPTCKVTNNGEAKQCWWCESSL